MLAGRRRGSSRERVSSYKLNLLSRLEKYNETARIMPSSRKNYFAKKYSWRIKFENAIFSKDMFMLVPIVSRVKHSDSKLLVIYKVHVTIPSGGKTLIVLISNC